MDSSIFCIVFLSSISLISTLFLIILFLLLVLSLDCSYFSRTIWSMLSYLGSLNLCPHLYNLVLGAVYIMSHKFWYVVFNYYLILGTVLFFSGFFLWLTHHSRVIIQPPWVCFISVVSSVINFYFRSTVVWLYNMIPSPYTEGKEGAPVDTKYTDGPSHGPILQLENSHCPAQYKSTLVWNWYRQVKPMGKAADSVSTYDAWRRHPLHVTAGPPWGGWHSADLSNSNWQIGCCPLWSVNIWWAI